MNRWIWQTSNWPNLVYDHTALARPVMDSREAYARLLAKGQAIGARELASVQEEVWLQDAMSTAAIEGEILPLDRVRSSVARRLGIRHDFMSRAPEDVEGLLDVMESAAATLEGDLTQETLFAWHASIFAGRRNLRRLQVGRFRTHAEPMQIVSGPVGQEKVHYEAPPSTAVPMEMTGFLSWFNASRHEEGVARAALAHLQFETIHPFEDGNGRLGRAIIDLAISQGFGVATRLHGFSNQVKKRQDGYYDALNTSQKAGGDVTGWMLWFAHNFRDGCRANELLIDQSLTRSLFWANNRHIPLNERQVKVLNLVLEKGPGGFEGGLTQKNYRNITGAPPTTAFRDLQDLQQKGLIKAGPARGRSSYYDVAIPGWEWKPLT